ncbi:MAG TPA: HAD-IC family P-type ATPase [Acidimicrobiales bacterium]|nr:HAD-IC family P-type ATPase [Acidimicrobiales bacterium]
MATPSPQAPSPQAVSLAPPAQDRAPTALTGLTDIQVAQRVEQGLTNDSGQGTSKPLRDIIRSNVVTPFNGLLGALAVIVLITGAWQDALFGLILVWNSLVGIVQEVRAKRTLDQLAVLNAAPVRVIRNGIMKEVAVEEVVLDDLVQLRTGDQVTADGVLRAAEGIEVDESLLSGESDPVPKDVGDQVLSGSIVVAGSGLAQVTGVGADSFASRLTSEARRFTLSNSELVAGINRILKYVAVAIVITGPILYVSQINTTSSWQEAVRSTVAGLVGMVPEGLVLLTSITFFAAALTLARRRVLVQELPAVEGLARVDVMCLDKTGTLTQGDIAFDRLEPLDSQLEPTVEEALAALAADDNPNATLLALREAFPEPPGWTKTAAVPFSSARKWSAAAFEGHGVWVLGAPELVWASDGPADPVRAKANELAASGSRTLLIAYSDGPLQGEQLPSNLRPMALVTFAEKIRPDAADTLRYFLEQGVAIKVISGDNPRTVGAVARRVGLPGGAEPVDARQLPADPDRLGPELDERSVFGRVTPQQKRAMVAGLQSHRHVVAMTGDGVNDALALKDADIGVAMGSGAAATKAVAQLVLLDSEFSVMPGVVAEGRRVIANIERVANLFLTKNVSSLLLSLSVAVAGWPSPFLPRHLTMVSTLAIGIPGFFLALGPDSRRFEPGFVRRVLSFAIPAGTIAAISVLVGYGLARADNATPVEARTAATIIFMIVSLWVLVIQARPFKLWKVVLVGAMAGLAFLSFATPAGQSFYDLTVPSALITLQSIAVGAAAAVGVELTTRVTGRIRTRRAAHHQA